MQREVCAAPDYKAMYFELFRASVQAAQLLQAAQQQAIHEGAPARDWAAFILLAR